MARKEAICDWNNRYLFPIKKEVLPLLKQWRNSQMNVLRQHQPLTDRDQEEWFRRIENDPSQVIFSLMLLGNGTIMKYIGYCGITHIDTVNRRGEISFLVDTARVHNKVLYREDFLSTLHMLCWYGFEKIGLNKLFTETFDFREFHIKILEEFGFQLEGRLRKQQLVKGRFCNSLIHSLLRDEWSHMRKKAEHALEK